MKTRKILINLMDRLTRFRKAEIGHGPQHPTQPNGQVNSSIEEFLNQYSILKDTYPDYIEFLYAYSGAFIEYECAFENEEFLGLDLFGLDTSVSGTYLDDESDLEDDGFLIFASTNYRYRKWKPESGLPFDGIRSAYFLLNLSSDRKNAIYIFIWPEPFDPYVKEDLSQSVFYCDTFLEWLERYVSTGGRIPEQEHDEFKQVAQQPVF